MNKIYKFRLYPNNEQIKAFNKFFGCNRFVYNYFLEKKVRAYRDEGINYSYVKMANMLSFMKRENEFSFLKEVDSVSLQQTLIHLSTAFSNFCKRKGQGYPKYKSKKSHHYSYTTVFRNNNIKLFKNRITIPKIGLVKMIRHRHIPSGYNPKSITVSKNPDNKYFVSILFEYENQIPKLLPKKFIGLDYSMNCLYINSDGKESNYPHYLGTSFDKLSREQRKLSHMREGSNNYEKQRIRIAKIHSHITNQRKDFLNKESRWIVDSCDCVSIEDLNMKNIIKIDQLKYLHFGKLAKDNSWSLFVNMLNYKLMDQGKTLIKIDKYYPSSQKCSYCGNINRTVKDFSVRRWECPNCGHIHNRDINAAINIREEGKRLFFDKYNRGTHGVSSPMLGSSGPSNEKHSLF